MYKSRAIPTLSGQNADYFREIQTAMEHTAAKDNWQSVGEGVKAMMRRAADEQEREQGFRNLAGCWASDRGDDDVEMILRQSRERRKGHRHVPSQTT